MTRYYELRCAVMEAFYGTILSEKYTAGQAADRCLVEFKPEVEGAGRDALVVLSSLLARVARHDRAALKRFAREVESLDPLESRPTCWKGLNPREKSRMLEDLRFIRKAARAG